MTVNHTVPAASTAQWKDGKRYLWLIGLVVPSLAFIGYGMHALTGWGVWFWIGPIVILVVVPVIDLVAGLDRSNPPGRRDRGAGEGPLLPLDHLPLPADPVRRLRRRLLADRDRRPGRRGQGRARDLDRLHRRHRHQHRPRARTQAREPRAVAVQDRAGPELLRALLHRAQPRPPRAGGDARGPGEQPGRRELLPVLAAHGARLAAQRLEPREATDRPPPAAPLPDRQRRAQRVADVGRAVGRDGARLRAPGSCPTW